MDRLCNYVLFHDRNRGVTHTCLYYNCTVEKLMSYAEQFEIFDAIEEEQHFIQEAEQRKNKQK